MAEEAIAKQSGLTRNEREKLLPSGKQRILHNRIHWAKFYLTKAGLLDNPKRGRFIISERGRQVLANPPDRLDTRFLLIFPEFQEFYRSSLPEQTGERSAAPEPIATPDSSATPEETPEETIEAAFNLAQAALRSDLLNRILKNSPHFFERVVVDLLVAMGYGGSQSNAAQHLGQTGDGGIDGLINEDKLGLDRIYVQAKRYERGNSVGRPEVQAFVGSLEGHGAAKGVFVTTSAFSTQAIDYAKHLQKRVILVNGERLTEFMIEHGVGVRTTRTLEFKRVDEDFFTEE